MCQLTSDEPWSSPMVLISGFLGPKGCRSYWGAAHRTRGAKQVFQVDPSPVGSLHHRACEIFYQLKGGIVDYGQEYADTFKHDRFGAQQEKPLFPEWDENNPVHLIGHSFGGNTARVLQQYLAEGRFPGHNTSAGWVKSLTTISAPLNGADMVYALGAVEPEHKHERIWVVRFLSPGFILGTAVHLWEFIDLRWLKSCAPGLDLGLSHWKVSWRCGWSAIADLFLLAKAGKMCANEANAAHDMTVHAMAQRNETLETFADTYYFSFVGNISLKRASGPESGLTSSSINTAAPSSTKQNDADSSSSSSVSWSRFSIFALVHGIYLLVLGCYMQIFSLLSLLSMDTLCFSLISLFKMAFFAVLRRERYCRQRELRKVDQQGQMPCAHDDSEAHWDGLCLLAEQRQPIPTVSDEHANSSSSSSSNSSNSSSSSGSSSSHSHSTATVRPLACAMVPTARSKMGDGKDAPSQNGGGRSNGRLRNIVNPWFESSGSDCADSLELEPGHWFVHEMAGVDHLGIVPFPNCKAMQAKFFEKLFTMLSSLDEKL